MSGGITSYGRTDADENSFCEIAFFLLATNNLLNGFDLSINAANLVSSLRAMSKTKRIQPKKLINYSIESRDLLFKKTNKKENPRRIEHCWQTMEVCSEHWKELNSIEATSLGDKLEQAEYDYNHANTVRDKIEAAELVGIYTAQYEISSLPGYDISVDIDKDLTFVGNTKHAYILGADGSPIYFQGGASYNINIFYRHIIPGSDEPLLFVGEAKGNSSAIGMVKGPRGFLRDQNIKKLRQDDYLYRQSRAIYMAKANPVSELGRLRSYVGKMVAKAYDQKRVYFIVTRGSLQDGKIISKTISNAYK